MNALQAVSLSAGAAPGCLPQPWQLAALGTVLCLYPAQPGGDLAGWTRAVRVEARSGMDSDGLRESLHFYNAGGACCWRLYLLPDSDFLAWERLVRSLPCVASPASAGIAERLWRRLAAGLSACPWQCSVLRFQAPSSGPGFAACGGVLLKASLATVSGLGAAVAGRIARQEGAGNAATIDECCCERAARAAAGAEAPRGGVADAPLPLIRLETRPHP